MIRISFGDGVLDSRAVLDARAYELLKDNERALGVRCGHASIAGRFGELIRLAAEKCVERTVVLVDEYDKPILVNITRPEVAREMREGLDNSYSVIKGQDAHIRFAMPSGVSKFSKVSLFLGLNNLRDIPLTAGYSAICDYTDADVDTVFAPELPSLDRQQIRDWYNSYN